MKPMLDTKTRIIEGCRKYYIELVAKAFKDGKDWKHLEKITRMNDATLRRWHDGTIQNPDVGNMLAAIISLGGTPMQAISYSGCHKLAFIISVVEDDPELISAIFDTLQGPHKERLREEALFLQKISKENQ